MKNTIQSIPFRIELRTQASLAEQDIEQIIKPVAKRAPARANLDRLLAHPDERVAIKLMNTAWSTMWKGETIDYVCDQLIRRGLREADDEGVIWTPLLDYLADNHLWNDPLRILKTRSQASSQEQQTHEFYGPTDRIERLVPWIEQQTSPKPLLCLLQFSFRAIHRLVARHARALSPELIEKLLLHEPKSAPLLAQNPTMPNDWLKELANWALVEMYGRSPITPAGLTSRWPRSKAHLAPHSVDTLLALHKRGVLDPALYDLCLTSIAMERNAFQRQSPSTNESVHERVALFLVGCAANLDRDQLFKLYDIIRGETKLVIRLVQTPGVNPDLWRHIVETNRNSFLLHAIAKNPAARNDQKIRKHLAQSSNPGVLKELLQDASDHEFRRLFRKLARVSAKAAVYYLEDHGWDRIGLLRKSDLELVVEPRESEYPYIQLRALLFLRNHQLADGSGEDFAREHFSSVFARTYADTPQMVMELLEDVTPLLGLISARDLMPILNSPNREERITAIRVLATLNQTQPNAKLEQRQPETPNRLP